MQGLGNDFLVFDAPAAADSLDGGKLRALADRRTGIGFDQALMLESPRDASNRVFYRVFNSDGTEAELAALMASRPWLRAVLPLFCTSAHHNWVAASRWRVPAE